LLVDLTEAEIFVLKLASLDLVQKMPVTSNDDQLGPDASKVLLAILGKETHHEVEVLANRFIVWAVRENRKYQS